MHYSHWKSGLLDQVTSLRPTLSEQLQGVGLVSAAGGEAQQYIPEVSQL